MNHGSGIFLTSPDCLANAWAGRRGRRGWVFACSHRLLGLSLGVWSGGGGVLGCSPGILGCEHGVVTLLPRIGEVAKEGTSVPMPWETTLGAIGGGRRGSWTSIFLCRGEAGGEKVA